MSIISAMSRGPMLNVTDEVIEDEQPASNSGAVIEFKTDGTVSVSANGFAGDVSDMWILGGYPGIGDLYEIKMSTIAGTFTVGSADEWLVLSSARTFTKVTTTVQHVSVQAALKIGYAGANSPLVRSLITLDAWKQS